MTRQSRANSRSARRRRRDAPADSSEVAPPRLLIDYAVAAALLLFVAFYAREWVNPDGVAYLENAEAMARGNWNSAIQGYWSPGYSMLLAPLVAAVDDDRLLLLRLAHTLQALVGMGALWLGVIAARRRVPAAMQRVAFWIAAWVIIVWLSQELLTPDLPLCACLLGAIVLLDRPAPWARITTGMLAGTAFVLKTSIWPWLSVAALLAVLRAARKREWNVLPWRALVPAAVLIAAWLTVLGVHTGRPTLGSVGPLNFVWYLGDPDRRSPDSDLGPHALYRQVSLPSGTIVTFVDLRSSKETYRPWSNPERWSQGVPAGSRPRFELSRASSSWYGNLTFSLSLLLPVAIGLAACAWLAGTPGRRASPLKWLSDRPLLLTGLVALAEFLAVRVENRTVAPAMLLGAFGALSSPVPARSSASLRLASATFVSGLAVSIAMFLAPHRDVHTQYAAVLRAHRALLHEHMAHNPKRGVIIIGPAVPWMGLLWVQHLHVAVQFGAAGSTPVQALPELQQQAWLQANFGEDAIGYGEAVVTFDGGHANTFYSLVVW
jgi:hypothetical protein